MPHSKGPIPGPDVPAVEAIALNNNLYTEIKGQHSFQCMSPLDAEYAGGTASRIFINHGVAQKSLKGEVSVAGAFTLLLDH